ncbi:uncharacterized protein LOC126841484 [Adelges cooleyi]|uniref:uncharacterized protein LOC126841484 n=1 Tax=Adelges cooleyi TaxID=133065 RepID=UPI00217FD11F|nr:uncharacterized protein LOC126841484 [Adelges cooleyi]
MFLKFSLSFLLLILAVSCMNEERKRKATHPDAPELRTEEQQLEDKRTIEKAFENCIKWMSLKNGYIHENISEHVYYRYMGDNQNDWDFIENYYLVFVPKEKEHYFIDLELFTNLFIKHCQISGKPVKIVAEERAAAVKKKDVNGNPVDALEFGVDPDGDVMSE